MGIIDNISASARAKAAAITILRNTENAHAAALTNWQESMGYIWGDDTLTEAVLKELGADAKSVFTLLNATEDILETAQAGVTTDTALLVKEHVVNEDGTIVLKGK
jgi:hypothetical protein